MCAIVFESHNQVYALVIHNMEGINTYNLKTWPQIERDTKNKNVLPLVALLSLWIMCHGQNGVFHTPQVKLM